MSDMGTFYRVMADSVNVYALPGGLTAYAGYVDGRYRNFGQLCHRFYPHAHCFSITVLGGNAAAIDCERGNVGPKEAGEWVAERLEHPERTVPDMADDSGPVELPAYRPCVYMDADWMSAVVAEVERQAPNAPRGSYRLWVAKWSDQQPQTIPAGVDAIQWDGGILKPYDLSLLRQDFFPLGTSNVLREGATG